MSTPCEYTLVEKPLIELLIGEYGPQGSKPGYVYLPPSRHDELRGVRQNEVMFTPLLVESLVRINGISEQAAKAIASELTGLTDNERWLAILRGNYSKKVDGEDEHRPIKVVDFDNPANNHFAVTNQLVVSGEVTCKPDLVLYLNGIPIVVIEAKSPLAPKQNSWKAVSQILQYEKNVPRLFAPNLFNIATNDLTFLYGATGAPAEHWGHWRDPWPRKPAEFFDETAQGVYALLAPERLLDILAHFIVFETEDGKTIKKICRYQQFRAVNKMVERVIEGKERQGLVWHTQGSGKSLTMVYAALKLKFHRGIKSERLQNPNLLVITDRVDLHDQITKTFHNCGIPSPKEADSIRALQAEITANSFGRTVMSTVFKFQWDAPGLKSTEMKERKAALAAMEVDGSENWILMVDEAHRTQEKDLGAYMRAVLPHAVRFGFTGTPVKKGDKDTFRNFGVVGESYLDKYGIQDAVADGATVPVYYQGRMTEWHLEGAEVDILFDQYFVDESEERREEIRKRGITRGDLARFQPRIAKIALDIWSHYKEHVLPDGFKAQIVAVDRPACVVYKKELDRVIAHTFVKVDGLSKEAAEARARGMSVCIYSPGQHDQQDHPELVEYQLDEKGEKQAIADFKDPKSPLKILIVCNKLLTGFDAPIEQAMYLDSPLSDHNLLQAIARTNRRYGQAKTRGSIIDYIGVSKNLASALAAYNDEDIAGAMTDEDALYADLQTAHREVMELLKDAPRTGNPKFDAEAAVYALQAEDSWFEFLGKANAFLVAYGALSPDPRVFEFKADLKYVGSIIPYGKLHFEASEAEVDWRQYSEKIREILDQHLEVTGLKTAVKLRSMSEPEFWADFKNAQPGGDAAQHESGADDAPPESKDLKTAAVRKLTELKKETSERTAKNPARYGKFSERIRKLIEQFQKGLLDAAQALAEAKQAAEDVVAEDKAFEDSGLTKTAYDVYKILEQYVVPGEKAMLLADSATKIEEIYRSHSEATAYWQDKPQSRKKLLQEVRRVVHPLGASDWPTLKANIDHFAVKNYGKP